MASAGGDKIAFALSQDFAFFADKHLDFSGKDQAALVKGMFMAQILLPTTDFHAYHYQVVADFRPAHNAGTKFLKLQGVYMPKSHYCTILVEFCR